MGLVKDVLIRFAAARAVHRRVSGAALARRFRSRAGAEPFDEFVCNICGRQNRAPLSFMSGRETPSCTGCASTLRFRTIIHALSGELFGESLPVERFPRSSFRGIGLSDAVLYAAPLAKRLHYTNTFFHREPQLDIGAPSKRWINSSDFVIASEVFEHVPPPVESAFEALYTVLRPGGVCVFSVPSSETGETLEHFPRLHTWRVEKSGGGYVLHNQRRDGTEERFDNLRFHGGPGATLEMRVFSHPDLVSRILAAGFVDVRTWNQDEPRFGIRWVSEGSYILSFRRPA